jgi:hypothetical protein
MVGLIAVFVLAFGPLTVALLTAIFAAILGEWHVAAWAASVTAVTLPMALWLASMSGAALTKFRFDQWTDDEDSYETTATEPEHPSFAIHLTAELPPLPLLARMPLGIWWLAHFLAATALAEFTAQLAEVGILWEGFADGVWGLVLGYLFHFAANVFLVLAVSACFQSPRITAATWRKRFLLDAIFTLPLLARMLI